MGRLLAAIAGVALAVGCGSGSPDTQAPGRFVYVGSPDGSLYDQALYTVDAEGSGARRLTRSSATNAPPADPEWSPDGTQVAYVRSNAIWIIAADGTSERRVIGPSPEVAYLAPTWSPDGERLAYVGLERDSEEQDLYVTGTDGGEPQRLTRLGSVYDPSWSLDGDRIAFSAFAAGRSFPESDLYTVAVDNGEVDKLTETSSDGEERPDWSPEGDRIAYERLIPGLGVAYQVWVMDADGTNSRIVSNPAADFDLNPVWAADSRSIAYHVEGDTGEIWVVAADGRGKRMKIAEGLTDTGFDWGVQPEAN